MPWGFVFFFQKPSSKSFEEELGNVGTNPGSDLGQDPGLSFPIRKRSRLDFLMVEGPFWLHFPRAEGTRTQADRLLMLINLGQARRRRLSAAQTK